MGNRADGWPNPPGYPDAPCCGSGMRAELLAVLAVALGPVWRLRRRLCR